MILIDVDGTLVDSVPDLAYCVDEMMRRLGLHARGEGRVREWVGNGVERLVARALVGRLDGEPDPQVYARAFPIFLELYGNNISARSRLYPGVREGLDALKAARYKLGCVTNKAERFTVPLLQALGISSYFGLVVSGDSLERAKPDPMPLRHAADFFGVQPTESLMLGDSVSDVRAARAAGFQVICVTYGYNHGMDIRDARPDAVIDSLAQVRGLLEEAA
ncbi:MAG: phosphoglycolate phosphatase [Gammaproteobacteria bacterium]|nr:phosphoglycolate phosphatase [Gammaproteobacteria bacterium]NIR90020.1 phosphoglycolate phosphatase [Gammaproteobacteria bacterium]NIR99149.1 phosphoglycolate phosphatase [Gammaproteobacteria bacterium]NIT64789.1 phosphoglycolate phosphatase [Gammaproteobacteria bacterium]NIV53639.1 phosphoglycolate phosphatase [Gammaproteobacteria bacterium]